MSSAFSDPPRNVIQRLPGFVALDLRPYFSRFAFQPAPRLCPRRSKSDSLSAVLVARQGAQFLQFIDRATRIQLAHLYLP